MPFTRKELLKIAKAYTEGKIFTAFDTETTGLSAEHCNIIEIGAVKFSKDGILNSFNTFVDPGYPIPYEITRLTSITTAQVDGAPSFHEIAPDFLKFIEGTTLIAHNCNFDVKFVNCELERNNLPPLKYPQVPAIDTIKTARTAFPDLLSYKQVNLAAALNIPIEHAHRANDDARVCMELFLKCLQKVTGTEVPVSDMGIKTNATAASLAAKALLD
ncbi:MAG: 3'-5' exonuclease [Treponemataceae bacterium]|nr:3'-5' exonuclease [Treponemataceae bacterium]